MTTPTNDTAGGDLLRVLLSVLLPPVGVAMEVGFTTQFWINVVLTLFGYIPGIIHALWIILRPRRSVLVMKTRKRLSEESSGYFD